MCLKSADGGMLASKQGFGGPAILQTSATEVISFSSSFGSTSVNALRSAPASVSDSQFLHLEVSKNSKNDQSKPLSLADKKLQRLARNRATASVSRYEEPCCPFLLQRWRMAHELTRYMDCCRSRKREHLHTLQMRVAALEQENKDLVQQVAARDAELKRYRRERGEPEGISRSVLAVSELDCQHCQHDTVLRYLASIVQLQPCKHCMHASAVHPIPHTTASVHPLVGLDCL